MMVKVGEPHRDGNIYLHLSHVIISAMMRVKFQKIKKSWSTWQNDKVIRIFS